MQATSFTRREFFIVAGGVTGAALLRTGFPPRVMAGEGPGKPLEYETAILKPKVWPDGKPRVGDIQSINGVLPGPTIRVNEDDEVSVTICNNLSEPTSIHWHGMHQRGTWFMDGVAMITQAPIPPGACYTYRFKAHPAGTHWYHSHMGVQDGDGVFGPLIVEEKENPYKNDYDYDRVIMINDWFHIPSEQILANLKKGAYMRMDMGAMDMPDVGDVPFESALINGKGRFEPDSNSPLETFEVGPNDRVRFRLINASSTYAFRFAIDGHNLSVIATDGALTQPHTVDNLVLDVGETYDVIVTADQPVSNYWVRAKTLEMDKDHEALAILRYKGASPEEPKTKAQWGVALSLGDLKPYFPRKVDSPTNNQIIVLSGSMMPYQWFANGKAFDLPKKPLTEDRNPPVTQLRIKQGEIVRAVINNPSKMDHPFHLHGHYFHVLGVSAPGSGDYNGQSLNETNPILKDTLSIPRKGWAVVQWKADNPGFWFFHCHVQWHMATGMVLLVTEGDPPLPPENVGRG